MTHFAHKMNQPPVPQGVPLPIVVPFDPRGFGQAVPPMPQAQGDEQTALPFSFPCAQGPQQPQGQPFLPFMMGGPQPGGAQPQQPGQPPVPMMPFLQFPNAQPQDQATPGFPFAVPFPGQAAPDAQPPAGQQGPQLPFAMPVPQPYEMYEQMLRVTIEFLKKILEQSEATHGAASQANSGEDAGQQADQGAFPGAFMPGFGCQQMTMPQQPPSQAANEVGMLPRSNQIGSLMGVLFGASNTDYFYED